MADINPRTMLDFKLLLKDWRNFQRSKLEYKMANTFLCSFNAQGLITFQQATVSFVTEGQQQLEFHHASGTVVKIPLTDLQGYNVVDTNIELVVNPERMLGSPIVGFRSQDVQALFLDQLESFTREMVGGIPTPSSSEPSTER